MNYKKKKKSQFFFIKKLKLRLFNIQVKKGLLSSISNYIAIYERKVEI